MSYPLASSSGAGLASSAISMPAPRGAAPRPSGSSLVGLNSAATPVSDGNQSSPQASSYGAQPHISATSGAGITSPSMLATLQQIVALKQAQQQQQQQQTQAQNNSALDSATLAQLQHLLQQSSGPRASSGSGTSPPRNVSAGRGNVGSHSAFLASSSFSPAPSPPSVGSGGAGPAPVPVGNRWVGSAAGNAAAAALGHSLQHTSSAANLYSAPDSGPGFGYLSGQAQGVMRAISPAASFTSFTFNGGVAGGVGGGSAMGSGGSASGSHQGSFAGSHAGSQGAPSGGNLALQQLFAQLQQQNSQNQQPSTVSNQLQQPHQSSNPRPRANSVTGSLPGPGRALSAVGNAGAPISPGTYPLRGNTGASAFAWRGATPASATAAHHGSGVFGASISSDALAHQPSTLIPGTGAVVGSVAGWTPATASPSPMAATIQHQQQLHHQHVFQQQQQHHQHQHQPQHQQPQPQQQHQSQQQQQQQQQQFYTQQQTLQASSSGPAASTVPGARVLTDDFRTCLWVCRRDRPGELCRESPRHRASPVCRRHYQHWLKEGSPSPEKLLSDARAIQEGKLFMCNHNSGRWPTCTATSRVYNKRHLPTIDRIKVHCGLFTIPVTEEEVQQIRLDVAAQLTDLPTEQPVSEGETSANVKQAQQESNAAIAAAVAALQSTAPAPSPPLTEGISLLSAAAAASGGPRQVPPGDQSGRAALAALGINALAASSSASIAAAAASAAAAVSSAAQAARGGVSLLQNMSTANTLGPSTSSQTHFPLPSSSLGHSINQSFAASLSSRVGPSHGGQASQLLSNQSASFSSTIPIPSINSTTFAPATSPSASSQSSSMIARGPGGLSVAAAAAQAAQAAAAEIARVSATTAAPMSSPTGVTIKTDVSSSSAAIAAAGAGAAVGMWDDDGRMSSSSSTLIPPTPGALNGEAGEAHRAKAIFSAVSLAKTRAAAVSAANSAAAAVLDVSPRETLLWPPRPTSPKTWRDQGSPHDDTVGVSDVVSWLSSVEEGDAVDEIEAMSDAQSHAIATAAAKSRRTRSEGAFSELVADIASLFACAAKLSVGSPSSALNSIDVEACSSLAFSVADAIVSLCAFTATAPPSASSSLTSSFIGSSDLCAWPLPSNGRRGRPCARAIPSNITACDPYACVCEAHFGAWTRAGRPGLGALSAVVAALAAAESSASATSGSEERGRSLEFACDGCGIFVCQSLQSHVSPADAATAAAAAAVTSSSRSSSGVRADLRPSQQATFAQGVLASLDASASREPQHSVRSASAAVARSLPGAGAALAAGAKAPAPPSDTVVSAVAVIAVALYRSRLASSESQGPTDSDIASALVTLAAYDKTHSRPVKADPTSTSGDPTASAALLALVSRDSFATALPHASAEMFARAEARAMSMLPQSTASAIKGLTQPCAMGDDSSDASSTLRTSAYGGRHFVVTRAAAPASTLPALTSSSSLHTTSSTASLQVAAATSSPVTVSLCGRFVRPLVPPASHCHGSPPSMLKPTVPASKCVDACDEAAPKCDDAQEVSVEGSACAIVPCDWAVCSDDKCQKDSCETVECNDPNCAPSSRIEVPANAEAPAEETESKEQSTSAKSDHPCVSEAPPSGQITCEIGPKCVAPPGAPDSCDLCPCPHGFPKDFMRSSGSDILAALECPGCCPEITHLCLLDSAFVPDPSDVDFAGDAANAAASSATADVMSGRPKRVTRPPPPPIGSTATSAAAAAVAAAALVVAGTSGMTHSDSVTDQVAKRSRSARNSPTIDAAEADVSLPPLQISLNTSASKDSEEDGWHSFAQRLLEHTVRLQNENAALRAAYAASALSSASALRAVTEHAALTAAASVAASAGTANTKSVGRLPLGQLNMCCDCDDQDDDDDDGNDEDRQTLEDKVPSSSQSIAVNLASGGGGTMNDLKDTVPDVIDAPPKRRRGRPPKPRPAAPVLDANGVLRRPRGRPRRYPLPATAVPPTAAVHCIHAHAHGHAHPTHVHAHAHAAKEVSASVQHRSDCPHAACGRRSCTLTSSSTEGKNCAPDCGCSSSPPRPREVTDGDCSDCDYLSSSALDALGGMPPLMSHHHHHHHDSRLMMLLPPPTTGSATSPLIGGSSGGVQSAVQAGTITGNRSPILNVADPSIGIGMSGERHWHHVHHHHHH